MKEEEEETKLLVVKVRAKCLQDLLRLSSRYVPLPSPNYLMNNVL